MAQQNINNNNVGQIITEIKLNALSDEEGNPKPFTSTIHEIGGLSWRMEVRKVVPSAGGPPRLDLYVYCNENVKDKLWLCNVNFTVHCGYSNPLTGDGRRTKFDAVCHHEYGPLYGFNTYYWVLEDIADDLERQPKEMKLIGIRLDVKITNIQKSFPPLDATLVIKTDENPTAGTFSINKYLLTDNSKYFSNLFSGVWSDMRKTGNYFEILETNDFDVQAFGFMIYSIMTMGGMVNRSNFLLTDDNDVIFLIKMVKMAIKYDMAIMVDYCEKVLMDCKDHSKLDLLELADQYPELNKLKEKCLNGLTIQDLTKNLAKTNAILSRLSENSQERLNAIMAALIKSENFLEVYSAVLIEKCHELAPKMLNQRNTIAIWKTAKLQEDKVEHCLHILDEKILCFRCIHVAQLSKTEIGELFTRDTLKVDEEAIFDYLQYWAWKQCKDEGIANPAGQEIRAKLGPLINAIRFPLMSPTTFINRIVPTGILTDKEVAAMFVHYFEGANVRSKKLFPLPFSAQPRAIPHPKEHNKLVDKNAVSQ